MEYISKGRIAGKERGKIRVCTIMAAAGASFLISRACFMGTMFPAGIALMTVLLTANTLNLYLLPVMAAGIGTFYASGLPIWGDIGALAGCSLVFLCTGKIRFQPWHKAVIAGSAVIIARSVYFIAAGFSYRISIEDLLLEGCLTAALCGIFQILRQLAEKKEPQGGTPAGVLGVSAAAMLMIAGTGFSWLLLPAAMINVLFTGYLLGTMEGLMAAFASGMIMLFCGQAPSIILVLALGGTVAGFSKGQNKLAAAICFAAAVMAIGLPDFSVNMAVPYYGPLTAALGLFIIPKKWLSRVDTVLSRFVGASYKEKQRQTGAAAYLEEVRQNFDSLAAMFVSQNNRRSLLSYEFSAMSKVLQHTAETISGRKDRQKATFRYRAEPAWAGYARNQGISGDSYLWEELPGGKFAVVLSDGMGKGKTAAAESSLAVNTVIKLLKAGLEVELVLKLLNSILLLNAENEIFSTIDLGIFNGKNGKMKFYKIGAATTFIKRKDRVETLTVSAMPMGIVDGLKIDYVTVNLNPGDEVIMISDGVTDSRREDLTMDWLQDTIRKIRSRDPQTMCDLIINKAVENYGIKEKDDLTVLTIGIQ
ncbi:SpoIIE family protein phosphatase [bacterium 210820-DFI.6.37]|nr:SpoIIE family protein phosphatase [bacterium 210820-DFI.6.37]